jgi:hypothetical protein
MHAWLVELRQVHPFDLLAYEQPSGPTEATGDRHLADIAMTFGIAAHIESYCCHTGVHCRRVGLGAWRRTFLGKGVGEKTKTMDGWLNSRIGELGLWRARKREEKAAVGLLDHLIILEMKHTPPWRTHDFVDLQAPVAAVGGGR